MIQTPRASPPPRQLLRCSTLRPTPLLAQNPPTERELKVYAGLHAAAANGDRGRDRRADQRRREDRSPGREQPHAAASSPPSASTYKAAEALLKHGANANARDVQGYDILTIAAVNNDIELAKLALANGANPRAVTGTSNSTALISAAHLGHVEIVRALIEAKAPLDHVNKIGWTALITAVVLGNGSKEHIATVEALVKAGADVDIKDRQGTTALDYARARRYTDMITIIGSRARAAARLSEPVTGRISDDSRELSCSVAPASVVGSCLACPSPRAQAQTPLPHPSGQAHRAVPGRADRST